jgi:hypothetical protein
MATQTMPPPDPAAATPVPRDGYAFDAFISHSDADRDWVATGLVRPLKEAGIRVLYHLEDLGLGLNVVDAYERAVQRSRMTIAVLTPDWLASAWSQMASLFAAYLDPMGENCRLVPLKLKPCEPPTGIRTRIAVDFTRVEERDEALARLLAHLGLSPHDVDHVVARSVSRGLRELYEMMQTPELREFLGGFQALSAENDRQTKAMMRYKRLHDKFQAADNSFDQLVQQRKALRPEAESWEYLEDAAYDLDPEVGTVLDFARDAWPPDEAAEIDWAGRLEKAQADLKSAVQDQNLKLVDGAVNRLQMVFDKVPSRVNDRLFMLANKLPLSRLVGLSRQVHGRLAGKGFTGDAAARLETIDKGIDNLERLAQRLKTFVTNHNLLQEIDGTLRTVNVSSTPPPDVEDIRALWPDLQEALGKLLPDPGKDWLPQLRDKAAALAAALDDPASAAGPQGARRVRTAFREFKSKATQGFNQVDQAMLRFCDDLNEVSGTLAHVFTGTHHV